MFPWVEDLRVLPGPHLLLGGDTAAGQPELARLVVWNDGDHQRRSLVVVDEDLGVVVYTQARRPVPSGRMADAARFVTRANWGLPTAALELDLDTGEARVRCGLPASPEAATDDQLRQLLFINVATATVYLPGLDAVIEGTDPDTAAAGIEDG